MQDIFVRICRRLHGSEIIGAQTSLPDIIVNHCKDYKIEYKYVESISAWNALNDVILKITNNSLTNENVTFSPRKKPLFNDGYISLSHSNGVVAVCYSKNSCAIEIELVNDNKNYTTLKKRLNLSNNVSNEEFFKEWTKIEAVSKLNDKFSTSLADNNIKTSTFLVNFYGKNYTVTVASNTEFNITFI